MQLEDVVAAHDVWRQVVAMASRDIHLQCRFHVMIDDFLMVLRFPPASRFPRHPTRQEVKLITCSCLLHPIGKQQHQISLN
eukprot:scaffold41100_cov57-Cyclotella_meneghiniana.AAC.5